MEYTRDFMRFEEEKDEKGTEGKLQSIIWKDTTKKDDGFSNYNLLWLIVFLCLNRRIHYGSMG